MVDQLNEKHLNVRGWSWHRCFNALKGLIFFRIKPRPWLDYAKFFSEFVKTAGAAIAFVGVAIAANNYGTSVQNEEVARLKSDAAMDRRFIEQEIERATVMVEENPELFCLFYNDGTMAAVDLKCSEVYTTVNRKTVPFVAAFLVSVKDQEDYNENWCAAIPDKFSDARDCDRYSSDLNLLVKGRVDAFKAWNAVAVARAQAYVASRPKARSDASRQ